MQLPTLTDVHVRTTEDAHKLFYAVELGKLPKIEKRLDAHERAALRPGNVYVWEEKPPNADNYAVTMERFTEGKAWTPSRVRDDFLMYYEKPAKKKGKNDKEETTPRSMEDHVIREGERDTFVKLTYSAFRSDDSAESPSSAPFSKAPFSKLNDKEAKPRKWHLNAYFTKHTEGQLQTIDDIPLLRDLVVPEGMYKTARSTPKNAKKGGDAKDSVNERGTGKPGGSSTQKERIYAAFPSSHPSTRPGQQAYHQRQPYNASGIVAYPQPSLDTDVRMASASSSGPSSTVSLYPPHSLTSTSSSNSHLSSSTYVPTDTEMAYAQASSGYPNYASYSSHLSSQSQQSQHSQSELYPTNVTQPSYEDLAKEGRNHAGSGYGSSEASPSPMSEYSTISWHHHQTGHNPHHYPHLPQISNSSIHEPFPQHPSSSQSHLHLHVNVHSHPQSHTPALSEASHSSNSSCSPYSFSAPMNGVARMIEDEEDLSAYVPAPPPFVVGDNPPYDIDDPEHPNTTPSAFDPPEHPHHPFDNPGSSPHQSSSSRRRRRRSYASEHGDDHASESGRSIGSRGSIGAEEDGGCARLALAPLSSLQRNHPYRRSNVDDKALRRLDPIA